jgi:hypothetical protein
VPAAGVGHVDRWLHELMALDHDRAPSFSDPALVPGVSVQSQGWGAGPPSAERSWGGGREEQGRRECEDEPGAGTVMARVVATAPLSAATSRPQRWEARRSGRAKLESMAGRDGSKGLGQGLLGCRVEMED